MRISSLLPALFLLASCAVEKKGILVDVEPGTPMDESDLRQHCDLGDKAACTLSDSTLASAPSPRFSIVQGVAPADRAVFAVLLPKGTVASWYVYDRELMKLTRLFTPKPVSRADAPWALQRLDARGLSPGRTYELIAGDSEGAVLDARRFRSLELDAKEPRISLVGGYRLAPAGGRKALLADALGRHPQLLVFSGSAVNAALPESESRRRGKDASDWFFRRHAEARSALELGMEPELVPVAALWNDDEFGREDGDRTFPQRDQAREQLELFFPHWSDENVITDGPGIALAVELRNQVLALVDDLSFRQPPKPGEEVCTAGDPKRRKQPACRPGKSTPPPPGSRHGAILRDWISRRAAKAPHPLWLLAGGRNVIRYHEGWNEEASLAAPALSRAPRGPWVASLVALPDGSLQIRDTAEK